MKLTKKQKNAIKAECYEAILDFQDDLNEMIDDLKTNGEKALEAFIYEKLKARVDTLGDLIELAVRGES